MSVPIDIMKSVYSFFIIHSHSPGSMINTRDEFATEYIARAIGMRHIELVTA